MYFIIMKLKTLSIVGLTILGLSSTAVYATELDDYLIKKDILDHNFKIKNAQQLNDILSVISDEDSRVMPIQIDQNTIIEKMRLHADHLDIQGVITSPDFAEFSNQVSKQQINSMLSSAMQENCHQIFEHEFQRKNPYLAKMKLSTERHSYTVEISNQHCQF